MGKTLKTRIVHKHDVEANWIRAVNFRPKQGEMIVYDIDETHAYERIKIGDGISYVTDLPFVAGDLNNKMDKQVGSQHAYTLLFVDGAGAVSTLKLGEGLSIIDGVLTITTRISSVTLDVSDIGEAIVTGGSFVIDAQGDAIMTGAELNVDENGYAQII